MPIVYACIAPHGGHLMLPPDCGSPVEQCRAALDRMAANLAAAQPDVIVVLTPHGIYMDDRITIGVMETAAGELDGLEVSAAIDLDFAAAWLYEAAERDIPFAPIQMNDPDRPFPLDWGVTIPYALLTQYTGTLPLVVACPGRSVSRMALTEAGSALTAAADLEQKRVALVISADQGHGHAEDGPYGFTPASAEYDAAMVAAVAADNLESLLTWDEEWPETALADSYWQTLTLIGVQRQVPLRGRFLAYQVDHYFGLLCAEYR